jgi:hypothetical protein
VSRLPKILPALILVASLLGTPKAGHGQAGFNEEQTRRATVHLMQAFTNPRGQTVISCTGSGTLVTADGLILTNAHVVLPLGVCKADRIAVAISVRADEAPVPKYYAEVVASNIGLDLAVLQITSTIDGLPVNPSQLALPFVELGNSDEAALDQTISFVGYAAPDNAPDADLASRVIRGTISGFLSEARAGERAWLKTRAALPGSMTGGGAYDSEGRLLGILTVEPPQSGIAGEIADCQRTQDSDGDGRIDGNDLCLPVTGLINAMRPSRLARGLILAARLRISPNAQQPLRINERPIGTPRFSRMFFAPGVDIAGMPTTIIREAPTGITSLYLFFDYESMVDGLIYELRVLRDGLLDPTFSLAPATWSGGNRGLWYLGSNTQVWPNGNYEFILFIEGVRSDTATFTVGVAAATSTAQFSGILFGVLNPENQLVNTGNVLPVANVINAEFVYNNIPAGAPWRQSWYYDRLLVANVDGTWEDPPNGKRVINAAGSETQPLQPGVYRLELYIEDRLAVTADFVMIGAQVDLQTEIYTNLTFATDLNENPGGIIGSNFPNTISSLYFLYDWRDIAKGTPITWRWTVDENPLFEVTQNWEGDLNGGRGWYRLTGSGQIADGSYKIQLIIAGVVRATATARVGLGQLPVAFFTTSSGTLLRGTIRDAETGIGINGAAVIVLKPTFDVADFTWQLTEVLSLAYTDASGQFELPDLLPRDEIYSVIVTAAGYLANSTDGLEVPADSIAPIELRLELNRD